MCSEHNLNVGFDIEGGKIDSSSPLTAVAGLTHRASEELQALDGIRPERSTWDNDTKSLIWTGELRACKTHLPCGKERALLGQRPWGPGIPQGSKDYL